MKKKSKFELTTIKGKLFILLSFIYFLGIANWLYPVIRTNLAETNYAFMLFIFFLPCVLIVMAFFVSKGFVRVLAVLILIPVIICSALLGVLSLIPLTDILAKGYDPSFEHLQSFQLDNSQISTYQTNGGATTSLGIVVRQEKNLVPGLLLVRNIYTIYPGSEAKIVRVNDDTIKIISPPYDSIKRPKSDKAIVKLKPWVYL